MQILSLLLSCGLVAAATIPQNPQPQPTGRTVQYGDKDILLVHARLRYTTLIELPKAEQILDFVCGDKEFWVVNGVQNFAFVKPSKAGARQRPSAGRGRPTGMASGGHGRRRRATHGRGAR